MSEITVKKIETWYETHWKGCSEHTASRYIAWLIARVKELEQELDACCDEVIRLTEEKRVPR